MDSRNVLLGLLAFLVITCICPTLFAVGYVGLESVVGRETRDLVTLLSLICCGGGLILFTFAGLGAQLRHIFQSRKAGSRLAAAMGLTPLNQSSRQMAIWYGGEHRNRPFAVKPIGKTRRYYWLDERRRITANFRLRILMQVRVARPVEVDVYRDLKKIPGDAQGFADAFALQNADWLTEEARTAIFNFVQQGYPTGLNLRKLSLRTAKGTRTLRLCDRATAAKDLTLPAEVLPDAQVMLVHDHPDTTIAPEELRRRLDELAIVARAVEASANRHSGHRLVWR